MMDWKRLRVLLCLKIILFFSIATASFTQAQPVSPVMATPVIIMPSDRGSLEISDRFAIAEDASGTQTLSEMQDKPFIQTNAKLLKGYSTNKNTTYWLRFTVASTASDAEPLWLDVEPPFLDSVELFKPGTKGRYSSTRTGDRSRFSTREIAHGSFAFRLNPSSQEPQTYYLRIQGEGSVWVRALLWRPAAFAENSAQLAHGQGITFGVLLLLMLLITLQGASFKDKLYFIFAAYVATTTLFMGSGTGIFARYLPDDWSLIAEAIGPVSVCLNVTTYAVFCRYFLYERTQDKLFRTLFLGLAGLGVFAAVLTALPSMRWLMPAVLGLKVIGTVIPAFSAGARLIKGHLNDRLVWLGILANIPVQLVLMLRLAGQGDQNAQWLSLHWFTAALLIHFLLLSFALVERARRLNAERRNFEQQVGVQLQLKQAAEKTATEQRSFLSMVAHELRGPLSTARVANHNLRQLVGDHPSEHVLPRLDRVETSLAQMGSLIEVCLSHEKQGHGHALSLRQSVKIDEVIAIAKSHLNEAVAQRVQWSNKSLPINYQLEGNTSLLAIALRNLIENASRYDAASQTIDVHIDLKENDILCMAVLDRGPGVDAALADTLFTQFSRGPQVQSDGLGVGLGLYIVQRIAAMHGGQVAYSPRLPNGSTFTISLPVSSSV
jgi:two-component system, sensor histidine kinase LadS